MLSVEQTPRTAEALSTPGRAPLRGTQSFVAVMGLVWKRPSLTALELLWRWGAGIPLLLLAFWMGSRALAGTHIDVAALERMTILKPADAAQTLSAQIALLVPALVPVLDRVLPLAVLLWATAAAFGHTVIWRRVDSTLRPRPAITGVFALIRALAFLVTLAAWFLGLAAGGRYAVTAPAASGQEPNLVLYTAIAVGLTLLLFLFWSLSVWVLDAAPVFAMAQPKGIAGSLRSAMHARALRSKLVEINLVMGIVKVCLLVLAMVFSATPVPFESVESQGFLFVWWTFVAVLYLLASDLFHVVRRCAYLEFFRALVPAPADTTSGVRRAS